MMQAYTRDFCLWSLSETFSLTKKEHIILASYLASCYNLDPLLLPVCTLRLQNMAARLNNNNNNTTKIFYSKNMTCSAGCDQISIISHRARLLLPIQPLVNTAFNPTGFFLSHGLKILHQLSAFPLHTPKCITASLWLRPAASSHFLIVIQGGGASPAGNFGQMRFSKSVHKRISITGWRVI